MSHYPIVQWGIERPWQNENQVEQDLLLSRAMIEIANDPGYAPGGVSRGRIVSLGFVQIRVASLMCV